MILEIIIILLLIKIAFFTKATQVNIQNHEADMPIGQTQFFESISPKEKFNQAKDIGDIIE